MGTGETEFRFTLELTNEGDNAAVNVTALKERSPFPVRAIQVDGGSEFMAQFEAACKESGVHLYVLPRHSPITQRPR